MSTRKGETKTHTIEEQIMDCENKLLDYKDHNHIQSIEELLHEELLFNIPGGITLTKQMLMDIHYSGKFITESFSKSDYKIHIVGDNAIVSMKVKMSGKFFNKAIKNQKLHFIRVWKLCDGSWKVITAAQSIIAPFDDLKAKGFNLFLRFLKREK